MFSHWNENINLAISIKTFSTDAKTSLQKLSLSWIRAVDEFTYI